MVGDKIPVINGLRGYAILCVVWHHAWGSLLTPFYALPFLTIHGVTVLHVQVFRNAVHAVPLFFLLSGLVLTLPYARGTRTMATPRDAVSFLRRRAGRLLPLYYVNVFVMLVFFSDFLDLPVKNAMWDFLLMFTGLFHFTEALWYPSYNGVLWSIGVEIWLSALLPFLLIAIRKYGATPVLAICFIASSIVKLIGYKYVGIGINYVSNNVLGDLFFFAAGMVVAFAYVKTDRPMSLWKLIAGAYGIVTSLILSDWVWTGSGIFMARWLEFYFVMVLFIVSWSTVTLELMRGKNTWVNLIVTNRPIQLIGMMCYSVYLWHQLLIGRTNPAESPYQFALFAVSLSVTCWLSYRYVEFRHVESVRTLFPEKVR